MISRSRDFEQKFLIFRSVKYLSFYSFEDLFRSDRIRPRPWYWLTYLDPKNTLYKHLYCSTCLSSPWRPLDPFLETPCISLACFYHELYHEVCMVKLDYFTWVWPYKRYKRFSSFLVIFFSDIYLYWIDCRWMTSQLNFQKLILVKLLLFNMRLKFSVGSIGLGWSEGGGVGADGRCWWRWWRRGRQISRQEMISLMKVNLGGTLGSHIKWPIHTLAIIMRIYGWIVFISIANTCTWFLSRFQ